MRRVQVIPDKLCTFVTKLPAAFCCFDFKSVVLLRDETERRFSPNKFDFWLTVLEQHSRHAKLSLHVRGHNQTKSAIPTNTRYNLDPHNHSYCTVFKSLFPGQPLTVIWTWLNNLFSRAVKFLIFG